MKLNRQTSNQTYAVPCAGLFWLALVCFAMAVFLVF